MVGYPELETTTVVKVNDNYKTKITLLEHPTDYDWLQVKKRAFVTVGKESNKVPDGAWMKRILKAHHSPIRYLRFSFLLENIPYWVSVHLCRHVHAQPYVKSQRNDRQSAYDREAARQDEPVNMIWDMNAEELITICNKRLCSMASNETRKVVRAIQNLVILHNPEFAGVLVPMCVREHECNEFKSCGYWDILKDLKEN